MKRIIRSLVMLGIALICIVIGSININLYYNSSFVFKENVSYNSDVYKQLQFLKVALRNGAGEEMQSVFPEGQIFINALYGLSWSALIEHLLNTCLIHHMYIKRE